MTTAINSNASAVLGGMNVVITGATTGIGRATAILLAQKGANIVFTGSNQDHLNEALNDIKAVGSEAKVTGFVADLATKEGIEELFNRADEALEKVDVLINNAALAFQGITDGDYEDWQRIVNTNLLGYMACTRYALDRMLQNGSGHIVHVGSMSADVREKGSSVYVATKAGIQGFAESLRKEVYEQGIKVTLIEPGAVDTDMQPYSTDEKKEKQQNLEMLQADDIAAAIAYTLEQPARCDVVELKIRPHLQMI
ncbi:oxidoreductase [Mucilaginibacter sp. MD40]|uniref:SDR family oxidoreductase n=1 Tax=Mucilaginibacter sp. MD40 TaxID=2029590 RepID=UPI000BACCBFC|nr:SDR family oxidoreductase [Mucilaginibacter sp. MD40]PAW92399.1 oxidoreductase [Mucilaginibacter sp. MD40]